jgi:hypothetical protein
LRMFLLGRRVAASDGLHLSRTNVRRECFSVMGRK